MSRVIVIVFSSKEDLSIMAWYVPPLKKGGKGGFS